MARVFWILNCGKNNVGNFGNLNPRNYFLKKQKKPHKNVLASRKICHRDASHLSWAYIYVLHLIEGLVWRHAEWMDGRLCGLCIEWLRHPCISLDLFSASVSPSCSLGGLYQYSFLFICLISFLFFFPLGNEWVFSSSREVRGMSILKETWLHSTGAHNIHTYKKQPLSTLTHTLSFCDLSFKFLIQCFIFSHFLTHLCTHLTSLNFS